MAKAFLEPFSGRPDGVGFRPITDADQPFLRDLYASTRETELAAVPWPDEVKQQFLAQQFAFQHQHYRQEYADADFLLILRHAEPIGRVYVHRFENEISLIDIALVPALRGQGIGSALLTELLDEARALGFAVNLHVEPNNPARRLYERLGFQLIEHRGVYDFLGCKPVN